MNRRQASSHTALSPERKPPPVYPFAAIVGQEEMKLALLLNTIDPKVGGVLVMGHRGTGKSTAVRALADLLPLVSKVRDCPFGCDPKDVAALCEDCHARLSRQGKLGSERAVVPVVELPLGATEDRVCGTINIERALREGVKAFEAGLLARANRGFLYIDEVNLLEDHLVDLLLDVAVTGRNVVEREGISIEHPSRFVLVGSGNPEEGELRPQLLDRFGLHVEVRTLDDLDSRVEIIERREQFERDAALFRAGAEPEQERLRRRLVAARRSFTKVVASRQLLRRVAELCLQLKVDGHRGELTITRAARALAAFEGRREVTDTDVRRVALMALRHRMRRDPLEQTASPARIQDALDQLFPEASPHRESTGDEDELKVGEPRTKKTRRDGGGSNKAGGGETGNGAGGARDGGSSQHVSPETDARLPQGSLDQKSFAERREGKPRTRHSSERRRNGGHGSNDSRSGRYARAVMDRSGTRPLALDATLRAAALATVRAKPKAGRAANISSDQAIGPRLPLLIDADALRYKQFRRKTGTLFILAIDASGSMALNRIGQAKGALARLLQRSYVRRDRVALVSFRGQTASLLLPPSQSMARAKRILDALSVGGATPLSAGLITSIEVAMRAAQQGVQEIVLLIFTDGRANVSLRADETFDRATRQRVIAGELVRLGALLRQAGVKTVVVDTQNRFVSGGEARALAATLSGHYTSLSTNPLAGLTQPSVVA
ncbi:MAG TPA: magnesium chelatase ATPase subunit I [Pyrinomonadaceae bacterium]|jgi:magnesium chelatase subunit D